MFLLVKIRDYPNGTIYCNCIVTKKICVILFSYGKFLAWNGGDANGESWNRDGEAIL